MDTDAVTLLPIIWNVMHNTKEQSQSAMGLAESKMVLYTIMMVSKDTLDEYYQVCKAQIDKIKTHSHNLG